MSAWCWAAVAAAAAVALVYALSWYVGVAEQTGRRR
jgi:hypothetical protein